MRQTADSKFIQSLITDEPYQKIPGSMKLFGQFTGSWDWTGFDYAEDGAITPTKGKWLFEWVLNGNAIQDIFIFENPDRNEEHPYFAEYGTTLRFPIGDGETWRSVWIGPVNKVIRIFDSRAVGSEIIMEGRNDKGELLHWIFSDITKDSLHWRGEVSSDNGRTWFLYEELDGKRNNF